MGKDNAIISEQLFNAKLQSIRKANKSLNIINCFDAGFEEYGKVYSSLDTKQYAGPCEQQKTAEGVSYLPSIPSLESLHVTKNIQNMIFGEIQIQAGWCRGFNTTLNALEYHKTSEVIIAVTDLMLLLGKTSQIDNNTYDLSKLNFFYVPQFIAVELYPFTLHFAPVQTDNKEFIAIIILPRNTNLPLDYIAEDKEKGDKFLFAKNKWLLAYPESKQAKMGATVALIGERINILLP